MMKSSESSSLMLLYSSSSMKETDSVAAPLDRERRGIVV